MRRGCRPRQSRCPSVSSPRFWFPRQPGQRAQPPANELPGGAQSLNEQHGDWVVRCAIASGKVHCSLSQSQVRQNDHRQVLSIELAVGATRSEVSGALVLPFGLRLSAGVDLLIDDKVVLSTPFSTCLQMGCLVPLKFGTNEVSAMSTGQKLAVAAVIEDSGKPIKKLTISLKGFTSALNGTGPDRRPEVGGATSPHGTDDTRLLKSPCQTADGRCGRWPGMSALGHFMTETANSADQRMSALPQKRGLANTCATN